jgi:hypothetical protein
MITSEVCQDVRDWQEQRRERAWDQALFGWCESTRIITEMAKLPQYRDRAVKDLGQIADGVLANNLMWSQLKKREAE